MTENNAAQPGQDPLTDQFVNAVIRQHGYSSPEAVIARLWQWIGLNGGENSVTLLMYEAHKALSKLRAEGVQAGDEREAFIAWLTGSYPNAYSEPEAVRLWHHKHVSALAWQRRAALESAPVASEAVRLLRKIREDDFLSDTQRHRIDRLLASAPVAGEAIAWREVDNVGRAMTCWIDGNPGDNPVPSQKYFSIQRAYAAPQVSLQCGSCGYTADPECATCSPAPQASEAVRAHNDAIKAAAKVCTDIARQYDPQNNQEHALASELYSAALAIRKLEKDGGDCAKGAGDGQQKYWLCCGSKDPNHPNRRAPDCFNATRAKWGTADQHSAAHPKQHNDGGAE